MESEQSMTWPSSYNPGNALILIFLKDGMFTQGFKKNHALAYD